MTGNPLKELLQSLDGERQARLVVLPHEWVARLSDELKQRGELLDLVNEVTLPTGERFALVWVLGHGGTSAIGDVAPQAPDGQSDPPGAREVQGT